MQPGRGQELLQGSKAYCCGRTTTDIGVPFFRLQSYNEECLIHNAALS